MAAAILVRTLLQTSLFIVAHDAMHGLLFPARPGLNHLFGQVFLGMYGGLSYPTCKRNHLRHHRHPASPLDPDFHQGEGRFFPWYRHFMAGYLSVAQLGRLAAGWLLLWLLARSFTPTALANLLLFVVLPLLLSSLQLFCVGTYWPHRGQNWGAAEHRCRTAWTGPNGCPYWLVSISATTLSTTATPSSLGLSCPAPSRPGWPRFGRPWANRAGAVELAIASPVWAGCKSAPNMPIAF